MSTITVTNLGKAYKKYSSKAARLGEWISGQPRHEKHWVLRDINFHIDAGESVGIIGVNGAGKSTLLKIITGTSHPTIGSIQITGRIAALLELGMGFHPDFTGRQNVYMAGQLLGLNSDEISEKMADIESFAEIGEYIDYPVRTYSSGMQMRLAFSVATAVRPDILIVDEALSVGDAYFQHKSFNKIREFRELGTSLLIVSHDKGAIQSLCDRALLLEKGFVIKDESPEEVMDFYNAIIAEKENNTVKINKIGHNRVQTVSGNGKAQVESIALLNELGNPIEVATVGERVQLQIKVQVYEDLPELVLGYMIKDRLGQAVFGTNTHHLGIEIKDVKKKGKATFCFFFSANIGVGSYSISTALHVHDNHLMENFEWRDLALVFNMVNYHESSFVGVNWMPPTVDYSL